MSRSGSDSSADAARSRLLPRLTPAQLRTLGQAGALFALLLALFALVQYAVPGLVDRDSYYHVRMARLLREQGLKPAFIWLPQTILNRADYYDHHFLFHVLLSLFAGSPGPDGLIAGAKLASVLLAACSALALWWLLRGQRVPYASLWTLALFALSESFLYRMCMERAQSASLLALLLALHFLLHRRYRALAPLGFLYVWMYDAFPLLLALAAICFLATWAAERRREWKALGWPAAGVALGLLLNPYFPADLRFIWAHLAAKTAENAAVGTEWAPYTEELLGTSGYALAALVVGALALAWRDRRAGRAALTAFGLAVFFGALILKSVRFIEYFPPFALVFAALGVTALRPERVSGGEKGRGPLRRHAPLWALLLLLAPGARTLLHARLMVRLTAPPAGLFSGASDWLRRNSRPGSLVFQTSWDSFGPLFFYNTQNVYLAGLDPTYSQRYDPERYEEWDRIMRGGVRGPGALIRDDFGTDLVFTDLRHVGFIRQAAADSTMREVYRDQEAIIYRVER